MKFLFLLFLTATITSTAFAQSPQTMPTDQGTLNINFLTDPLKINPGNIAKMQIDFINPKTNEIQVHIDYNVKVSQNEKIVFDTGRQHTATGSVKIPVEFVDVGKYLVLIEIDGILFQPIPLESSTFEISVGEYQINNKQIENIVNIPKGTLNPGCERTNECYIPYEIKVDSGSKVTWKNNDAALHTVTSGTVKAGFDGKFDGMIPPGESFSVSFDEEGEYPYFCSLHPWMEGIVIVQKAGAEDEKPSEGGGCLIATATFGTELAPQVQKLRELRDNTLLQTNSGTSFMKIFNSFYYSFSPTIADLERQNPVFKEAVKISITPLLSTLSILNYFDIDSEVEMLGYGIGVILMNVGMYFVAPALVIIKIKQRK